jgi:Rrf2 family protein
LAQEDFNPLLRAEKEKRPVTAKQIATLYGLPLELTAKTLQKLKEKGFVDVQYGNQGGYFLHRSLEKTSLSDLMEALEGPTAVVPCAGHLGGKNCEYDASCGIQGVMMRLNSQVTQFLSQIVLIDLLKESPHVEYFSLKEQEKMSCQG